MPAFIDLTGQVFNNLTVISRAPNNANRVAWNCLCICGNTHVVESRHLNSGEVKSCGCLSNELRSLNNPNNNGNPSNPAYKSWIMMKQRCYNPNYTHYVYYGGLGITVYQPWIDSFEEFITYMGPRPDGYTLDRIDSTLGYYPGNVRWASRATQVYNRDYTRLYNVYGTDLNLREIANLFDVDFISLSNAINRGWDLMLWISIQLEYDFIEPLDQ